MFQLNKLSGLVKKRKKIGRGGSRGGTSGKGHKGQKARSGSHGIGYGFEGGQMPIVRRLPKRGFNNVRFGTSYTLVNLSDLEENFSGDIEITKDLLIERGIIKLKKGALSHQKSLIKLLGDGTLTKKLVIHVDAASKSAAQAVINAGGTLHLIN